MFLYEKLRVYKLSMSLANELLDIADNLPWSLRSISDQLRRAAISIPSNIAEGNSRIHKADRRRFFYYSRGSSFECSTLIELCYLRTYLSQRKTIEIKTRLEEISKILFALAQKNEVLDEG